MANRLDMDKKYMWDLSHIFKNIDEFEKSFSFIEKSIEEFKKYDGKLNVDNNLYEYITLADNLSIIFGKVYGYANMSLHQDMSITESQGLANRCDTLMTKYMSAVSFFEPEILSIGQEKIFLIINNNPKLETYTHFFEDIFSNIDHILSKSEERIIALASEAVNGPENIFDILQGGDMTFDDVVDDKGEMVKLTHSSLLSLLRSKNREVRKNAFITFYKVVIGLKNTLGTLYSSKIKNDIFIATARNYPSCIEMYLSQNKIPIEVYTNLIDTVSGGLDLLHRYIKLRKDMLGVDELNMYDMYTSIVEDVEYKLSYEEACELVLKSVEPMGMDYVAMVKKAIDEKWIDVYENDNKRSGAYSWGIYGTHPFILLNYKGDLDDAFTLAHELGHAMHSHYSSEKQDYVNSNYPIFLAEIASTVNEALLMDYLLKNEKDDSRLKFILNNYLDGFRGTLFRQVMFAEFEMKAHSMAEEGLPLNYQVFNDLYIELNKKYYGKDVVSNDEIAYEWARIPHFYSPFYVYQYATGHSAAISFSKKILAGDTVATEKYKEFLSAGCSDYPLNILKKAGIDMSSKEPIENALKVFEQLVEKMERLNG